jgi:hypothetical protein
MTLMAHWLPTTPQRPLDAWHMDDPTTQWTWQVTSTPVLVHGPIGRFATRRVHRREICTVADRPWGSWRVVLHRQVRKFCCANGRAAHASCSLSGYCRSSPLGLGGRSDLRTGWCTLP